MTPPTRGFAFHVLARDGAARRAVFETPHGAVDTPTFMPVGTQGSVKTLSPSEVASTGARVVLANTYHLMLRPGADIIAGLGGLHAFTRWPHAMLTDSGGFQAYSLSAASGKRSLVELDEEGFTFRSHLDGSKHTLTPEEAVRAQALIGADIQMQLDVCPPGDSPRPAVEAAIARTTRWARRALAAARPERQALFGIVQGACFADLRRDHAIDLGRLPFDGLALGGFSVGEPIERMHETLARSHLGARRRATPLRDGHRHATRYRPRDRRRGGHVRLRPADAQRAKRPGADADRTGGGQASAIQG